jgi:hypothetical protein
MQSFKALIDILFNYSWDLAIFIFSLISIKYVLARFWYLILIFLEDHSNNSEDREEKLYDLDREIIIFCSKHYHFINFSCYYLSTPSDNLIYLSLNVALLFLPSIHCKFFLTINWQDLLLSKSSFIFVCL